MTRGGRDRDRNDVGGAAAGRGGGGRAASTADVGAGGERPHEDVMAVVEQVGRGGDHAWTRPSHPSLSML